MKLTRARIWIAAASLVAVVVLVWVDLPQVSPGPLNSAHAVIESLDGLDGCVLCHGRRDDSYALTCGNCHPAIADQIDAGRGLHGGLGDDAERCERCHHEHVGDELPLAGDHVFQLAGFEGVAGFNHASLARGEGPVLALLGHHAALDCKDCHENASERVLQAGTTRFLGLSPDCASCHADPHAGALPDCRACHDESTRFDQPLAYDHERFELSGAHAGRSCVECHADTDLASLVAESSVSRPTRTCSDCHEHPHTSAFLTSVAAIDAEMSDCAACHGVERNGFREALSARRGSPAWHSASGLSLVGAHALDCAACHEPAGGFGNRDPADCAACHQHDHSQGFLASSAALDPHRAACNGCHRAADSSFFAARDALAQEPGWHAASGFALVAPHLGVACALCHVETPAESLGSSARYPQRAPDDCAACHDDPHSQDFADGPFAQAACRACHALERFRPATFDVDAHSGTRFELTGAHRAVACEGCHDRPTSDSRLRLELDATACSTCHLDAHLGAFDEPTVLRAFASSLASATGAASSVNAGLASEGCARCHGTHSFEQLSICDFEHGLWANWPLDGAHASLTCESCHARATSADELGRRFGRAELHGSVDDCASCHDDVHGGRLSQGPAFVLGASGKTGCARCHGLFDFRSARTDFDHAGETGFALEGGHLRAGCEACHPSTDGAQLSRTALGHACHDCHRDPHAGQFYGPKGADCARCHDSTSWGDLRFDHALDAQYALDASHAELACAACHQPSPLASGELVVRYKPLPTTCAGCHGAGGRQR